MSGSDALEGLKTAVLDRLGLPEGSGESDGYEVVATVLGPRDPDGAEVELLVQVLADRLLAAAIVRAGGARPSAFREAVIDFSDEADCDDPDGETGSAFVAGKRCYRIVMYAIADSD